MYVRHDIYEKAINCGTSARCIPYRLKGVGHMCSTGNSVYEYIISTWKLSFSIIRRSKFGRLPSFSSLSEYMTVFYCAILLFWISNGIIKSTTVKKIVTQTYTCFENYLFQRNMYCRYFLFVLGFTPHRMPKIQIGSSFYLAILTHPKHSESIVNINCNLRIVHSLCCKIY